MKYNLFFTGLIVFLSLSRLAAAESAATLEHADVVNGFQNYKLVTPTAFPTPHIVEVPLSAAEINSKSFALYDIATKSFVPYFAHHESTEQKEKVYQIIGQSVIYNSSLTDENYATYQDFPVRASNMVETAEIVLVNDKPITASEIQIGLEPNSMRPESVEVRATVNGNEVILVAQTPYVNSGLRFPQVTATSWRIRLYHNQPLRIAEVRIMQINATLQNTNGIRFLAQPGHAYELYYNSDRSVVVSAGESPMLSGNQAVTIVPDSLIQTYTNSHFVVADTDGDGVPDKIDNCPSLANPDQVDVNMNRVGDLCDDFDRDGIINAKDNCPNDPNYAQTDSDGDRIGDACDKNESRLTEQYPWLPWVGIGTAITVLLTLFAFLFIDPKQQDGGGTNIATF